MNLYNLIYFNVGFIEMMRYLPSDIPPKSITASKLPFGKRPPGIHAHLSLLPRWQRSTLCGQKICNANICSHSIMKVGLAISLLRTQHRYCEQLKGLL